LGGPAAVFVAADFVLGFGAAFGLASTFGLAAVFGFASVFGFACVFGFASVFGFACDFGFAFAAGFFAGGFEPPDPAAVFVAADLVSAFCFVSLSSAIA